MGRLFSGFYKQYFRKTLLNGIKRIKKGDAALRRISFDFLMERIFILQGISRKEAWTAAM